MVIAMEIDWFLALGFAFFAIAFFIQSWYYRRLKDVVFVGYGDASTMMVLLANYDKLETKIDKVARLLRLTSDDQALDAKKEDIIKLLSISAEKILMDLKANVPESKQIIEKVEKEIVE